MSEFKKELYPPLDGASCSAFISFIHGLPSRRLPLFHKVQLKKPTATEAAHIAIMTKG
jgi:hypothetical protein